MKQFTILAKITSFFGILIFICSPILVKAQDVCGLNQIMKELYELHPELKEGNKKFLESNKRIIQEKSGRSTNVYTIPVVFHVLHEYGAENVSDLQIQQQVERLNLDFRKKNSDTTDVVAEFKNLVGDSRIEFKLASKDFQGNCTNGIDRIYTHETRNGDDMSKFNPWPREKYLNIWIAAILNRPGVAGYAYKPTGALGSYMYFVDGIMMQKDYVGLSQRTLTHEVGHYLGLSHTWGGTNEPGCDGTVATAPCFGVDNCEDDDGIEDTPNTRGFTQCTLNNSKICDTAVVENIQNYMEYAFCSRMFTIGQGEFMEATLNNNTASRDNLSTLANLIATGTDIDSMPTCAPVADFFTNTKSVCQGSTVTFNNASWRANVDTYSWTFADGTPAVSTVANPTVTFNTPGYKAVTLTVTNSAGTDTKTENSFIFVSTVWADFVGTHHENFETHTNAWWQVENPGNDQGKWEMTSWGENGSAYGLKNAISNPSPFYYARLGGKKDALISPSYDLRYMQGGELYFTYSCATRSITIPGITEDLKIYFSTDCGRTWIQRKSITGINLVTAGVVDGPFTPTTQNDWKTDTISIPAGFYKENVKFKFEYTASDNSNNIYLGDVRIGGAVGIEEQLTDKYFSLNIFPNPSKGDQNLNVSYLSKGDNIKIAITNLVGKVVYTTSENKGPGENTTIINMSDAQISSGIYFLNISDGIHNQTKKVVVY
ncbi:MAG: M43 family zinc metalloprotease [Bacteroidota bacterium]|nr:M43 family zinc metalloprotease [Bacteroidota bacterium]